MSLLLYAVTSSEEKVAGAGLGGMPLQTVEAPPLAAIVSGPAASQPRREELWEYDHVLERLMARHVILPARFGSLMDSRMDVRELLERRQKELRRSLDRVRGTVEFGVTTGWRDQLEPAEPETGTDYLLGRLALHRRASDVARRLEPLGSLARSSRQRVLPRPTLPVTASYLVETDRTEKFIEMVACLDGLLPHVDVVCTGPWPPYSFVEAMPQ
jgi:Gas vesicle synthesis protein GvpL/GvpF